MRHLRQPSPYTCLATSYAMLLGILPSEIFQELGRDGSEPYIGHHPQEFLDLCDKRNLALTIYEVVPIGETHGGRFPIWDSPIIEPRLKKLTERGPCVMTGLDRTLGKHAWAWDGEKVFDPALHEPGIHPLSSYYPQYIHFVRAVLI